MDVRRTAVVLVIALTVLAACSRDRQRARTFAQSLRCGMTRAEAARLAKEHGFNSSDGGWLTRSASSDPKKSKALTLVDLTFRSDRLVALKQGTWNPRTKRVEYRTIDLCNPQR